MGRRKPAGALDDIDEIKRQLDSASTQLEAMRWDQYRQERKVMRLAAKLARVRGVKKRAAKVTKAC